MAAVVVRVESQELLVDLVENAGKTSPSTLSAVTPMGRGTRVSSPCPATTAQPPGPVSAPPSNISLLRASSEEPLSTRSGERGQAAVEGLSSCKSNIPYAEQ